jgi:uncharacterized membrane protein (UPF0127 family)
MTTMIVVGLLAAACSSTAGDATTSTTSTTPSAVSVPPQLADYEVQDVQVGDRTMLLAIADNPSLRRQGLQFVTDLEDLEGMLFFWRHDGDPIWMKDTPMPLDIVWFNEDGTYKDRASMEPCTQTPCPEYTPADDLDFRFAIEAPPGALDWVSATTVITHSD